MQNGSTWDSACFYIKPLLNTDSLCFVLLLFLWGGALLTMNTNFGIVSTEFVL